MSARAPRYAAYLRVSTSDQSTDAQRLEIESFLAGRNIPAHQVTWFDETISSQRRVRPQFDELRAAADRGAFEVLIVVRLDRLGRSLAELVTLLGALKKQKIGFITLAEGFDTTTPVGELMLHVAASFAQYERALISERTRAGVANARAKGKRIGRPRKAARLSRNAVETALAQGKSIAKAAKLLSVAPSTLRKALSRLKAETEAAMTQNPVGEKGV